MVTDFLKRPEVKEEVERLLLGDLQRAGIQDTTGLKLDWSDAVEEGHYRMYKGVPIENASNISVINDGGESVYLGWVDFIIDKQERLYFFWNVGNDFELPDYIWEKLSEEDRFYLADTHQGWRQDKKIRPYRKIVVKKKIEDLLPQLVQILDSINNLGLPSDFNTKLYLEEGEKIASLAKRFLAKKVMDPNISSKTYLLYQDISEDSHSEVKRIVTILRTLEIEIREGAISIKQLT